MGEIKKQINIEVRQKIASLVDKEQFLVCGNNDYEVVFDFDSDWDGVEAKTAVFVYGDTPVHLPFNGNVCDGVAVENATLCAVGVFAGDIKTTTGASIRCVPSIRDIGGVPNPPAPEVYDKIMALLDEAIQAHTELPKGGKVGQVLKKKSDKDYDTAWEDDTGADLAQDLGDSPDKAISQAAFTAYLKLLGFETSHAIDLKTEIKDVAELPEGTEILQVNPTAFYRVRNAIAYLTEGGNHTEYKAVVHFSVGMPYNGIVLWGDTVNFYVDSTTGKWYIFIGEGPTEIGEPQIVRSKEEIVNTNFNYLLIPNDYRSKLYIPDPDSLFAGEPRFAKIITDYEFDKAVGEFDKAISDVTSAIGGVEEILAQINEGGIE